MTGIFGRIFKVLGRFFARHRNNLIVKGLIKYTAIFHNNMENVNFNSMKNGEEKLLKKIADLHLDVIFDVGANVGEWALMANRYFPGTKIHSFEILPKHWEQYRKNVLNNSNICLNEFGLSDSDSLLEVYYNNKITADSMATLYPQFIMSSERDYYDSKIICPVKKGETYLLENKIQNVDFLKIDVEGHELKVIKGFGDHIKNVRLIQFEFGVYNITSKDLLWDFFNYLGRYNFAIGRLYPSCVDFFDYDYTKENLSGGNYIAINKDDKDLVNLLSVF